MRFTFLTGLLIAVFTTVAAQTTTCPTLVEAALTAVDEFCTETSRNQVCYGSVAVEAEPQSGAESFTFEQVGDIVDVADVQTLTLEPMAVDENRWGVVLMRLQANLPDTLPGQNVTFVLFGDVEITNAVEADDDELTPMQAFYLKTGVSDSACEEAPESGLLVQTPEGVGEISFVVNEVEVQIGSTVFFQAQPGEEMIVSTVEGSAVLNAPSGIQTIIAGTRLRLPIDRNLRPLLLEAPPQIEAYEEARMRPLPIRLLQRQIEIRPPLARAELQAVRARIQRGEPLCSDENDSILPTCDRLPTLGGGRPCVLPGRPNPNNRPVCELPEGAGEFQRPDRPGIRLTPSGTDNRNTTDRLLPTLIGTALPAGCERGICLRDPAEACRCVLCGVACPADQQPDSRLPINPTQAQDASRPIIQPTLPPPTRDPILPIRPPG